MNGSEATATLRRGFELPRLARFIVQVYPRSLGLLFLVTATQKALDDSGVARVLAYDGVPEILVGPMVQTVAGIEAFLGVLLLLRPALRLLLWATIGLLSIYTLQLAWLAASGDAPGCACLAAWEAYQSARVQNLLGIGRNLCLILPLVWVISQVKGRSDTSAAST